MTNKGSKSINFNSAYMDNVLSKKTLGKVASEERIVSGSRGRTDGASVVRHQRVNSILKQGI